MDATFVALADAKYEAPLGKNTMDAMIVDAAAALFLDLQRGEENGHAVSQSRAVFGVGVLVYKIRNPAELTIDEHQFNERPNARTVAFREFEINGLRRSVHHSSTRLVWPLSFLNIVPMLHCPAALKSEDFKADFTTREIIFCMCKDEIAIFKGPHNIHAG